MKHHMILAALFCLTAGPALAQQDDAGWHGQITPYVWASGLGGDIQPFARGPSIGFDKSFSDVMEDLDAAFFLSAYARRDRMILMGDFSYSSASKDAVVGPGVPVSGKLRQTSMTVLGGWRAVAQPDLSVDLLAGARFWKIRSEVEAFGGAIRRSPSKSFADPIIAVRANFALAPRWSAIVYGDYGGFGVGSDSTSQMLAVLNYQVNDRLYVSGGYRQLNVDYREGMQVDATMAGPIFGLTWQF